MIENEKNDKSNKKKKIKKNKNIIDNSNSDRNDMITSNKNKKKKKKKKKFKRKQKPKPNIHLINNNNINNNLEQKDNNNENIIPVIEDNRKYKTVNKKKEKKIEKVKNIMKYIDDEINLLTYDLAIQCDKRTFSEYYFSLLKTKQIIIFAFYNNNDYNSKIIKIDLFFISFTIYYTVNALFYNDDKMHKIYVSKGKFDLEAQIPIIIYSTIISTILNALLKLLALSNDSIIAFKKDKTKINVKKRKEDLLNKLNIKFIFYFIISFIFLSFFWYYIAMFCVIYKNTQVHLLKDTLISFGLSMLYPFGIYLLPGLFRIPALSNEKYGRKYMYNFSKALQIL